MLYALSVLVAPVLTILALMLWASYREERDLLRLAGHKRCWRTRLTYTSAGICLGFMIFVTHGTLISSFL